MDSFDIAQWVAQNGLAVALVMWGMWFVTFKLWPWLTETYIPSRQQIEHEQSDLARQQLNEVRALRQTLMEYLAAQTLGRYYIPGQDRQQQATPADTGPLPDLGSG